MNHTERINATASRHRHLTRRLVKEAVDTYLELLAEEIADGEWVEIPSIGKIQVSLEAGSGHLIPKGRDQPQLVQRRLRTKLRLGEGFKQRCYSDTK